MTNDPHSLFLAARLSAQGKTIDALQQEAQRAEETGFDAVLLDGAAAVEDSVALAFIARGTERIGLFVRVSVETSLPFNVARALATLDHVSGGRAGVVLDGGPVPGKAGEYLQVLRGLWGSWSEGALVADAEAGRFLDRSRITPIDFEGEHYRVAGPLNLPAGPQGQPLVLAQASAEPQVLVDFQISAEPAAGQLWQVNLPETGQGDFAEIVLNGLATQGPAGLVLDLATPGALAAATELLPALRRAGWLGEVPAQGPLRQRLVVGRAA